MKKYVFLLLLGFAVLNLAGGAIFSPSTKEIKTEAESKSKATKSYIAETKAAITRRLKEEERGAEFEISKIVFTSESSRVVAGQRQVELSFTYELKYLSDYQEMKKGDAMKQEGTILLAKDENGNWFDSTLDI